MFQVVYQLFNSFGFIKEFEPTMNRKTCDLKNTKHFWMKVTTSKISKNKVKKFYNKLIQKEIDALKREESNSNNKYNILEILENIGAIFTGTYLHYKEVP